MRDWPDKCPTIGMPNKALQQNRDDVLRYGESIGCDLLKAAVRQQEAQSQSSEVVASMVVETVLSAFAEIRRSLASPLVLLGRASRLAVSSGSRPVG